MDVKKSFEAFNKNADFMDEMHGGKLKGSDGVEMPLDEFFARMFACQKFEAAKNFKDWAENGWIPLSTANGDFCSVRFLDEKDRFVMFDEYVPEQGLMCVIRDMENSGVKIGWAPFDHWRELLDKWEAEHESHGW